MIFTRVILRLTSSHVAAAAFLLTLSIYFSVLSFSLVCTCAFVCRRDWRVGKGMRRDRRSICWSDASISILSIAKPCICCTGSKSKTKTAPTTWTTTGHRMMIWLMMMKSSLPQWRQLQVGLAQVASHRLATYEMEKNHPRRPRRSALFHQLIRLRPLRLRLAATGSRPIDCNRSLRRLSRSGRSLCAVAAAPTWDGIKQLKIELGYAKPHNRWMFEINFSMVNIDDSVAINRSKKPIK